MDIIGHGWSPKDPVADEFIEVSGANSPLVTELCGGEFPAVIQRRTVLLETWQRAATSLMVRSCSGAGSFAMARQSLCMGALLDGAASSTGPANVSLRRPGRADGQA